jgi:sulfite exporter TauE/SafE
MCGPLVLTIPTGASKVLPHLLYNLGRITTYTFIGLLLGAIGSTLTALSGTSPMMLLHRTEIIISFFSALLLIWLGLLRLSVWREPKWMQGAMPSRLPGFRSIHQGVVVDRSPGACYLFGVLLGLLPCGLSYAAFGVALASGNPLYGALNTFAFGLGTLPGLLLLGTAASQIIRKHRRLFDLLAGLVMLVMAVSFIIQGITRL